MSGRGRGERDAEPRGLSGSGAMKDSDEARHAGTDKTATQAGSRGSPADPEQQKRTDTDVLPVYAVLVDAVSGDWIGQPVPTGRWTTALDWARREDTGHEHYRIHGHREAGEDELRALILQWVFH